MVADIVSPCEIVLLQAASIALILVSVRSATLLRIPMLVPYSSSTLSNSPPEIAADAAAALLLLAALVHCCTMERPVVLEIWTPRSNSIKLSIHNHPYSDDGPS